MSIPSTDPVAELRALMLAAQRFRQAMADHLGLTLSEMVALGHLADTADPLTPRDLADRMLLGTGTLTAILDRLAGKGFTRRIPNPHDRRSSLLELTPDGRRAVRYVNRRLERILTAAAPDGTDTPAPTFRVLTTALSRETDRTLRTRSPQ